MDRFFSTVSSKGQMVIPAPLREALGIQPGTRVGIRLEGTLLILEPETLEAKRQLIDEMQGCTAGSPPGTGVLLEDRRLEQAGEGW